AQVEPPSRAFWLGTTHYGRDVLSQVIVGSRVAFIVGIVSAFFIAFIGTNVGLVAGYYGRRVDDMLMRLTDIVFGLPFLPWSVVPPGLCITLFTASVFLIGREYERVVNPRLDRG